MIPFKWLLVGFLCVFSVSLHAAKRNVVLVISDDHGQDLGCYGNPVIQTPNLDSLANEGTRFTRAFCTTASCSASRSVILTGLHNHANGQFGHQHAFHNFHTFDTVKSLPVLLAEQGYRTARIGKYHVQPESVYHFETVLGGNQGGARNPVSMAERCRSLIEADDERPFFLYFCTTDPHRSGTMLTDKPGAPNGFGNEGTYAGVEEVTYSPDDVIVPDWLPDTQATRAELAEYYQSVSRVDQGVGRLMEILREAGEWENTLFIYTSDNGAAFPGSKTTLYEPGMKLPLIVRGPDEATKGVVSEAMVSWVDLTPTILDFAEIDPDGVYAGASRQGGQPLPDGLHGRSFLETLDGEFAAEDWSEVYASHTFHEITMYYPMRVVRTGKFKLILNLAHQLPFPFASDLHEAPTWRAVVDSGGTTFGERSVEDFVQRPRYELYNVEADPHESNNLADNPEFARTLADLQARLKAFQEATDDPWIVKYDYE